MPHKPIIFVLFLFFSNVFSLSPTHLLSSQTFQKLEKEKKFKILCLDGGGVRGIISSRILQEIEEKTGKPISQLFDLIVGTSTGGLIAIALTIPDSRNTKIPKYSAKDMVALYLNQSQKIFSQSIFRKLTTGGGLWGAKYDRDGIDAVIQDICENTMLSATITPIAIVSYSLDLSSPHIWTTNAAKNNKLHDYKLFDIGGATSAAPTYFPPKIIQGNDSTTMYEADGGLYANNPETVGMVEALKYAPNLTPNDIIIVSIGTGVAKLETNADQLNDPGVIGWFLKANLMDIMFNANSEWAEIETKNFYTSTIRLQITLPENYGKMDNCTSENLEGLLNITNEYLDQNKSLIETLCNSLK